VIVYLPSRWLAAAMDAFGTAIFRDLTRICLAIMRAKAELRCTLQIAAERYTGLDGGNLVM
jgi:hypothetical protein